MKTYLAPILAYSAIALTSVSHVCAQQQNGDPTTSTTVAYYNGGSAGVNTNDMYYSVTSEFFQNATQSICFVDPVLPPEAVEQICPGGEKMPYSQCVDACESMGISDMVGCPINLAGCCDCPFFSFKFNDVDSGTMYAFDGQPNIWWTGLPGWFNVGVWIVLTISLVYLLLTMGQTSSKTRKHVVKATRALGLIGSFMFSMWILTYLIGLNAIAYQSFYGWSTSAAGIFLHVFFSGIWLLCGIIQFIGPIRHRYPRLHRMNGWFFVASAILSTIGLGILCLSPHLSSMGGTIVTFIFGTVWMFYLFMAIKTAIQRKIDAHRVWMTRHMFLGASVAFQRVFNVLNDYMFKDAQYYVGSIYEPLCVESQSLQEIQVIQQGNNTEVFNSAQSSFLCNGINHLFTAYTFTVNFIITLVVIGVIGAEVWLYVCGLHESQKSSENANVSISVHDFESDMPSNGTLTLHRKVEEMPITLVQRSVIAADTAYLRFKLPNESDAVVLPLFGHVNLWKSGMTRPRPYSPLKAVEPGHVSFYVRNTKAKNGLSKHMVEDMQIGDKLFLSGPDAPIPTPLGAKLTDESSNTLVLAAGTGVATFKSFLDTANGRVTTIVLDNSKDRAIDLGQYEMSVNISIDRHYNRGDYIRGVEDFLVASKETPWDAVLICGPNAFNLAMKKHVNRILPSRSNTVVYAIGTDDR